MSLLLASWLLTQCWDWPPVEGATHYRLYWSDDPAVWCEGMYLEYAAADICDETSCQATFQHPGVYVQIVSVNQYGIEAEWPKSRTKWKCP